MHVFMQSFSLIFIFAKGLYVLFKFQNSDNLSDPLNIFI